jgi:iron(III) transport system substrate-binding protein
MKRLVLALLLGAGLARAAVAHTLTVYAAFGYDRAVAQAFTRSTGIAVDLVHLSTGPLQARVQAEGARPQWDIVWFDGDLAMRELALQHRLACGWLPNLSYTPTGQSLLPADRCYLPVGLTYAGTLLVDTARMPELPQSWAALTQAAWRGKVGMNNPAISGPTFPFVAGMLEHDGMARGKAYFEHLKANGLKVYPTNSVTLRALQYGQIDAAVVQSSAALGFASSRPGFRIVAAPPQTALPSDIAIGTRAHGQTLQHARRFVEFVLSPAGQKAMQQADPGADSNYQPLLRGIAPRPAVAHLPVRQPLMLDPVVWGPREAAIDAWFNARVLH